MQSPIQSRSYAAAISVPSTGFGDHLIVIDHDAVNRFGKKMPRVVGTYRLLRQDVAEASGGFYSATEFDMGPLLQRHAGKRFLELGRSCVLPEYRSNGRSNFCGAASGLMSCITEWMR